MENAAEKICTFFKIVSAGFCAFATFLWGGLDTVFTILLCLIAIDYITGVLVGIKKKELSSEISFNGLLKKVGILCIVALAHFIGGMLGMPDIRSFVIGFYIANEGISILENTGKLGVVFPERLLSILKQLKDKDDGDKK